MTLLKPPPRHANTRPLSVDGAAPVTLPSRAHAPVVAPAITQTSPAHVRRQADRTVAVVITETTNRVFGDSVFSPLVHSISEAMAERSLLMVMLAPQSARELAQTQAFLLDHVDGAILVSLHGNNQLPNRLRERGIATVLCGRPPRGIVASSVDANNRQGATMAAEHLIDLGRHKIATISGNLDQPSAIDRQMGYRDALAAAGLAVDPTLEEVADYLPDRAHIAMERLLLNHPDVDAVFAASDLMAAAAIRVLHQARRRIPEDVAVVGFDDSPTARATRPPLTSVRQPIGEIGREVVNIVMRELAEPQRTPLHMVFETELVVRESTAGAESGGVPG